MRKSLSLIVALIFMLSLFSFMESTPSRGYSEEEIKNLIGSAETPEEHMKLAQYYEKRAEMMEEEGARHEGMAKLYEKRAKMKTHMPKHCNALAAQFRGAAEEYRSMAKVHRYLAEGGEGE